MPKSSVEQGGFSLKNWNRLSTEPKFGSLIDIKGDRFDRKGPKEKIEKPRSVNSFVKTSYGEVEFSFNEDYGLDIFADDIGLDLFYDENGRLKGIELDLFNYCDISRESEADCDEEDDEDGFYEGETVNGSENLIDLVQTIMMEDDSQWNVYFDLAENMVEIVSTNIDTGDDTKLFSSKDEDIFKSNYPIKLTYGEYTLCFEFGLVDDVFSFCVYATIEGEELTSQIGVEKILTECN